MDNITRIIRKHGLGAFRQAYRIAQAAITLDGYTIDQRLSFAAGISGLMGLSDNELTTIFVFCCDNRGKDI
jgi:hypothetical protein